jgi:hypothetical protein
MPAFQQVMMTLGTSGGVPTANLAFEWFAQTEGLSNGASVPQLTDTSGNSNNATQGTSGFRGVYNTSDVGGKASVTFDGGNDTYALGSSVAPTDFTIYAIWKVLTGSAQDASITGGSNTGINYQMYTGSMNPRLASVGLYQSSGGALSQNTWYQSNCSFESSSNNWDFRNNKTQANSGTNAHGSWSPGVTYIGSFDGGTGRLWQGRLAGVLIYTVAHSTSTKQSIESFISTFFANAV